MRVAWLCAAFAGVLSCTAPRRPDTGAGQVAGHGVARDVPLRRLTRTEYDNTLRDLLGDVSGASAVLTPDGPGGSGFDTAGLISEVELSRVREAAEDVAGRLGGRVAWLVPCAPATLPPRACAARFIDGFAARAFRRPLGADEAARLLAVYDAADGHDAGVRLVVEAILQAPQFLYRWELGPGARPADASGPRLTDYEVASRLSYFLWQSMPDEALFAAARAGRLQDPTDVAAQARRMLLDPRARGMAADFVTQLLGVRAVAARPKDTKRFREFSAKLAASMLAETRAFATHVVIDGDGRLDTLLRAPFSFLDEPLARLYGVKAATDDRDSWGAGLRRVALETKPPRRGLLMQASFLATGANAYETYPHLRGKVIREQLLCGAIPPPPPGVPPLPKAEPGLTTRARFEDHRGSGLCGKCHRLMDDIGYAFEHYDAIGRHRADEDGHAIDDRGTVYDFDGRDVDFEGPGGLLDLLAASPAVQRCVVRQVFRYALAREDRPEDAASLAGAERAFLHSGGDLRALMVALTTTPSFLRPGHKGASP